jgi:hypothetical protein
VKLYTYSTELRTFVETKWVRAVSVTGGILLGVIVLFFVIKLNPSVGNTIRSRSTNTLASDNNFLRQQVIMISPRVSNLEIRVRQLNDHANDLKILLPHRKIMSDTLSNLIAATKEFNLHSSFYIVKDINP